MSEVYITPAGHQVNIEVDTFPAKDKYSIDWDSVKWIKVYNQVDKTLVFTFPLDKTSLQHEPYKVLRKRAFEKYDCRYALLDKLRTERQKQQGLMP